MRGLIFTFGNNKKGGQIKECLLLLAYQSRFFTSVR